MYSFCLYLLGLTLRHATGSACAELALHVGNTHAPARCPLLIHWLCVTRAFVVLPLMHDSSFDALLLAHRLCASLLVLLLLARAAAVLPIVGAHNWLKPHNKLTSTDAVIIWWVCGYGSLAGQLIQLIQLIPAGQLRFRTACRDVPSIMHKQLLLFS